MKSEHEPITYEWLNGVADELHKRGDIGVTKALPLIAIVRALLVQRDLWAGLVKEAWPDLAKLGARSIVADVLDAILHVETPGTPKSRELNNEGDRIGGDDSIPTTGKEEEST